ncbi:RNA-directed DNA polymerase from mobile element jockey [Elysia marginata]|uniref:RNA-directed DNA polymerase from mobile element jockey n=1 Tax=Elysia marginata TaxID=1093978 RepID=A0AAV4J4I5_9GAST|nr:RNA-directed DNA polymerase from mobile element jockey [Elysia marginata]
MSIRLAHLSRRRKTLISNPCCLAGGRGGVGPRRGPPQATGDSHPSCGRGGQSKSKTAGIQEKKSIKIMHWNAHGIKTKKLELGVFLTENKIDVCAIQETHLKEEERFWIRGYKDFRQDRMNRKNGSIITLVNTNTLTAVETYRSRPDGETVDQDTECLGIELILPSNNLHVYNIYSPPDKDFQFEPQVKQDNFIVVGDFNSHSPSWGYKDLDSKGEKVEDWAIDNQLILLNRADDPPTFTSMTWRTSSTPDIAFATDDIQGRSERSVESQLGARVKLDGKYYSKQVIMKEGVPQGSAISPTLFLVYINDITSAITPYVKHTLHADDFSIWSTAEYATTAKVRVQATVDKTKERDVTLTMNGQPLPTEDTPTFLGITLDKRLTWKPHIQKIKQKAIRRSQIMKKLSGTKWGANSKILRQVYQGYIRPVMEYASPAWSTAATSNLTSLSKTQNQNLRIVLGAIKATPIKELHKQAEMDTLENRREQRTLTLYEKSKRNPTHPLHNILREKTKNRLKSRKSPNHVMKEQFEENQDLLWQTDRYESLKLAESPWENNKVSISYTIPGIERKNEEDTNNLRVKTLEHIDNTYPHDTWTHIYTDGSSDNMKAGGAGIHIWHSDGSKEDIAKATGSICSNFKAEVIAIKTALEHIQANQDDSGEGQKYIIFCDSQAALQS